jgi:hypothetical protein
VFILSLFYYYNEFYIFEIWFIVLYIWTDILNKMNS